MNACTENKSKAVFDSSIKVNDTQFGRALKELSVELIAARSPQAKGRIERLWQTLQDRLTIEFALRDITSIDEANKFLETYIYAFNSEFAVEPQEYDNMLVKPDESLNLDYILCIKETRTIDAGGVISYGGKSFKVVENAYSGMILNRDYENSSIPSSMKPNHKKIANSREKTGRKPGGQPGHKGHSRKRHLPTNLVHISAPQKYTDSPNYKLTGKIITKQMVNLSVIVTVDEYSTPEEALKAWSIFAAVWA